MKKIASALCALLLVLCAAVPITQSGAAGPLYFTGVNDTLLPLSDATLPATFGGGFYMPFFVFNDAGVYGTQSTEEGRVRLYRGWQYVDFYASLGISMDQDNQIQEVSVKVVGGTYYLPLQFVCDYFGLTYSIFDSGISGASIPVLRIISSSAVNDKTFAGYYRQRMQETYDAYVAEVLPGTPTQTPATPEPTPSETPPPVYDDVSVYLCFSGLSDGYADDIISLLDSPGYRSCFFVTADEILSDPGLVRRISGDGHLLGVWLEGGGYDEYLGVSALLFEAAKVKTVLVSSDGESGASEMAEERGLIYWSADAVLVDDSEAALETIRNSLPTVAGARKCLRFSCAEDTYAILPGVLSYLRRCEYNIVMITETVEEMNAFS